MMMTAWTTGKGRTLAVPLGLCVTSLFLLLYWTQLMPSSGTTWAFRDSSDSILESRDIEHWAGHHLDDSDPLNVPFAVNYLWCVEAKKQFRFKDYLSVVSALRMLRPVTLVFHYNHLPDPDLYNDWFPMLKWSQPNLQLQILPNVSCGSDAMLDLAMGFLAAKGGVFIGQGVLLARAPTQLRTTPFSFHFAGDSDKTRGMIFARQGFREQATRRHREKIVSSPATCVPETSFNEVARDQLGVVCISFNDSVLYPRDIMLTATPFAELARWLFYGKRAPVTKQLDPNNLIPRISHYVKLRGGGRYSDTLTFHQFLSILSALYVGGFHRVYLHAEGTPRGQWWEELKRENVTVLTGTARITSVFSNRIAKTAHISDVIRLLVLYKYGGAYQDFDVLWVSRVNDSLLACPTVMAFDWGLYADYPEQINNGVILSRRHSKWLRLFLETMRDYRDKHWIYNSAFVPYKQFEKYPELVCLHRRLQTLCHNGICHQPWLKNYRTELRSRKPTPPFTWDDVNAVHVTAPKAIGAFSSPEKLNNSHDFYARMGRLILEKSGRMRLLG